MEETGSTNVDLAAAARRGEPEQVLGADFQTAGKGRLGRSWEAGPGASILCSVLVRPEQGVLDPHLATTVLALATAEAIEAVTGHRVGIKWPNDLVASPRLDAAGGVVSPPDDRKLAGVLAESVAADGQITAVVIGIGVNVNWPDPLPDELADIAVSLRQLVGHDVDRSDLLVAMLSGFDSRLAAIGTPEAQASVRDAVSARSATVGRTVRIERADDELVGRAAAMTDEGHLVVESDGERHEVTVGDVIHLRPATP